MTVFMKRFIFFVLFLPLHLSAVQEVTLTVFRQYDNNAILWGGDGTSAWDVLQLERRGVFLWSYVLQQSGNLYGLTINIADNDTLQNVCDRLATNPIPDFKYVNWGGDWSGNITPYYPTGHLFVDSENNPVGVVVNQGGEFSTVPVEPFGNGYVSEPVVINGTTGTFQIHPYGDSPTGWATPEFVPNWGGGVTDDSQPTQSTGTFNPSSSNEGGTDGSFVFPTVPTVQNQQGQNVVSIPAHTYTDSSGNTFTTYDYRGILSSIGGVLQSHAEQNHNDMDVLNENFRKFVEISDDGNLAVAPTDDTEYTVDTSDADSQVEVVSGWGFDFGMSDNPIGRAFTSILGNPPTSFGSTDRAWDIDFNICDGVQVHSSFSLSDWFPRAFRSTILFIATIIFAVATAKAVSGAFS